MRTIVMTVTVGGKLGRRGGGGSRSSGGCGCCRGTLGEPRPVAGPSPAPWAAPFLAA